MIRYLRLLWLLVSSLLLAFGGFMLALAIMLPFMLRYSSDYVEAPLWIRLLSGLLCYGLPTIFFIANMISGWHWADGEK